MIRLLAQRPLVRWAILLSAGCFHLVSPRLSVLEAREQRPNIIFLFADDQAYDTLGCYGNPDVQTPHIDRLGEQGLIFDRHYNTTAICMASRANVMTGLLEYRTGCNFMHGPMIDSIWQQSYPVALRRAGYYTGFGGKFGFAVVKDAETPGSENRYEDLPMDDFDVWFGGVGQTGGFLQQVGATNGTNEDEVTREDAHRFVGVSALIGEQKRDAFRRVTRGVHHVELDVADRE